MCGFIASGLNLLGVPFAQYKWVLIGVLLIQFVDVDHFMSLEQLTDAKNMLVNNEPGYLERGVFHDLGFFFNVSKLMIGVIIGWVVHLRMDSLL